MTRRPNKSTFSTTHRRQLWLFLSLISLCLLAMVSSTLAWTSNGQSALNAIQNTTKKVDVHLVEYVKEVSGKETTTPIEGTTFALFLVTASGETQVGSYVKTDKEGKLSFHLPPGDYVVEEITPTSGYTFDKDDKNQVIKRTAFTVKATSTNDQPLAVIYNRPVTGQLEINKKVVRADGAELTDDQKKEDFQFTVDFSDQGTYAYRIDGGEGKPLTSGKTLTLKQGQKAVFDSLPEGIHYRVTEAASLNYQAQANNNSGTITSTPSVVDYVNTYQAGQLELTKTVVRADGAELTEDQKKEAFSFEVTFSNTKLSFPYTTSDGRKGTVKSGDSLTLSHGQSLTMTDLPIGISYQVKEKDQAGYTAQRAQYEGLITKTPVTLPFVNEWKTEDQESGSLSFTKKVVGDQKDPNESFNFEVTFSDGNTYPYQRNDEALSEHKSGDTLALKAGDTISFPQLPTGVNYTIVEKVPTGYQAETTQLTGTITKTTAPTFTFVNDVIEEATLTIHKIGLGEGFDPNEVFSFNLWINGEKQKDPIQLQAGQTSLPLTLHLGDTWRVEEEDRADEGYAQTSLTQGTGVVSSANQKIEVVQTNTFTPPVQLTLSGQKHWVVPEGKESLIPSSLTVKLKAGERIVETQTVTGPNWTYQFTVPKYDTDGKAISYQIDEDPVAQFVSTVGPGTYDLTNTYVSAVSAPEKTIEKKVVGDQPEKAESFTFSVSPGEQPLTIKGAGKVAFPGQTYTLPGTYHQTVTENNLGASGYDYDTSVYERTVVVVQKETQLVIASDDWTKNGQAYQAETLVFTNSYQHSPDEKETLTGQKRWVHGSNPKALQPKTIIVYLYANHQLIQQRQVTEQDDWKYQFEVPVYDSSGHKINYQIGEAPVAGYRSETDGFNLINRYEEKPESSTSKTPPSTAQKTPDQPVSKGWLPKTGATLFKVGGLLVIIGLLIGILLLLKTRKRK